MVGFVISGIDDLTLNRLVSLRQRVGQERLVRRTSLNSWSARPAVSFDTSLTASRLTKSSDGGSTSAVPIARFQTDGNPTTISAVQVGNSVHVLYRGSSSHSSIVELHVTTYSY
jgi:hypothetical protein